MAHLKRYGQNFNVNIEKMTFLKKIGLLSRPEVSLSRIVSTQKAVFKAFFFRKTLPEAQRTQGIASKLELSLQLMVAPLALVPNLATRWRHLHELKNWPQDGATCISCMS